MIFLYFQFRLDFIWKLHISQQCWLLESRVLITQLALKERRRNAVLECLQLSTTHKFINETVTILTTIEELSNEQTLTLKAELENFSCSCIYNKIYEFRILLILAINILHGRNQLRTRFLLTSFAELLHHIFLKIINLTPFFLKRSVPHWTIS